MSDDPLLARIERFLRRSGMTATAFGRKAVNDPSFVANLRKGRECRNTTRQNVMRFIADELARLDESAA